MPSFLKQTVTRLVHLNSEVDDCLTTFSVVIIKM